MEYEATVSTPIGKIGLHTSQDRLTGIDFVSEDYPILKPKTVIAKNAVEQLLCYFADPAYRFDIPLELNNCSLIVGRFLLMSSQVLCEDGVIFIKVK